ncbi:hypothetical protein [Humibacter ginsenosidimutans]|uniref:Uncharacterized protein n=1 Tax=Humibacter ginsenosidimutans TaxID=2599293 RepID=A0A5B8M0E3_9MICO|nr:hypothetical protein [Humibacter ginsenosidimutans]QDZ13501.1 hypothetical protein FPZ11_00590 [Humibacter ginsenosidimutans]
MSFTDLIGLPNTASVPPASLNRRYRRRATHRLNRPAGETRAFLLQASIADILAARLIDSIGLPEKRERSSCKPQSPIV